MAKLKLEAQNSSGKTKDNLEKLRRNFANVEEAIEKKNKKAYKNFTKLRVMTTTLEKLVEASGKEIYVKCRSSFGVSG